MINLLKKNTFLAKFLEKVNKKLIFEIADARIQEIAEILFSKNVKYFNFF